MKNSISRLAAVLAGLSFGLAAEAGNLVLVGDSTLAPRKPEVLLGSWGDSMTNLLAEGWSVANFAVGGKTVRTIQEGGKTPAWTRALAKMEKGDFVIVQFGINDANPKKLVEVPDFKAELAKFADLIRSKGATPVFCSPIAACLYDKKTGKYVRSASRDKYAVATREIAAEKNVDFVDMTSLTGDILAGMDKQAGESLYVGATERDGKKIFDTTHARKSGAKVYGEAFAKDVKARSLPIARIFK